MTITDKSRKTFCDEVMESPVGSSIPDDTVIFNVQHVYEAFESDELWTLPVFVERNNSRALNDYRTRPPFDNLFVEYRRDIDYEEQYKTHITKDEIQLAEMLRRHNFTWMKTGMLFERLNMETVIGGGTLADDFSDKMTARKGGSGFYDFIPFRLQFYCRHPYDIEPEIYKQAMLVWFDKHGHIIPEETYFIENRIGFDWRDFFAIRDIAFLSMALIHHKSHDVEYVDFPSRYIKRERRMGNKPPSGSFHINLDVPTVQTQIKKHGTIRRNIGGITPHKVRGYFRDFSDHSIPHLAELGVHWIHEYETGKEKRESIKKTYSVRIKEDG